MKYLILLLSSSVFFLSLNATERISPNDENEFPEIKPIAVELKTIIDLDSDNDGVLDSIDECPNTLPNTIVDIKGCELDDDKDGVVNSKDKCPTTPEGRVVDMDGCQLDSDNDGVVDYVDECPDTPEVFKVDFVGCPLTAILKVNFDTNKYNIKEEKQKEIQIFAQFLNDNLGYDAIISGHTDSIGSDEANQILSENRANAVKEALIKEGIASDRLTSVGEGEKNPIANNSTEEGRTQNRRIEVELKSNSLTK